MFLNSDLQKIWITKNLFHKYLQRNEKFWNMIEETKKKIKKDAKIVKAKKNKRTDRTDKADRIKEADKAEEKEKEEIEKEIFNKALNGVVRDDVTLDDIISALSNKLDNKSVQSLLYSCYEEIMEHKFRIVAHLFYIIDLYIKGTKYTKLLKNKVKKWIYELYYDSRLGVIQKSKEYIQDQLKTFGVEIIDFNTYDIAKIIHIQEFLRLEYNNANVENIEISESNGSEESSGSDEISGSAGHDEGLEGTVDVTKIKKCFCNTSPCCCDNYKKVSYSDYKNSSFGATNIINASKPLSKLHNSTKFQERQEVNREELEFNNYLYNGLCVANDLRIKINNVWNLYKEFKINDSCNIKIRNKHIHFLYLLKLVTCFSYQKIFSIISVSSLYLSKVKINLLCDLGSNKLHVSIENSFDKFFGSFYSENIDDVNTYKNNHIENKKAKYKIDDRLYDNLMDFSGKPINDLLLQKVKKRIEKDLVNNCFLQNIIYDIFKSEKIKVTKKEIHGYVIKYY
jgi:hypothetical protein